MSAGQKAAAMKAVRMRWTKQKLEPREYRENRIKMASKSFKTCAFMHKILCMWLPFLIFLFCWITITWEPKSKSLCSVEKKILLFPMSTESGGPLNLSFSIIQKEWGTVLRSSNLSALVIPWPHSKSLHPCWAQSMWVPWPLCTACLTLTMPYPCHKAHCSAQ